MDMSRIDFQNIAASPWVSRGENPLPAPPRIPFSQGWGTETQKNVSGAYIPGEAEWQLKNGSDTSELTVDKQKEILKDLELPVTSLRLKVDKENKRIVIQILDEQNQVIRQIPPEEWLRFLSRWQKIQGLFFDKQV